MDTHMLVCGLRTAGRSGFMFSTYVAMKLRPERARTLLGT